MTSNNSSQQAFAWIQQSPKITQINAFERQDRTATGKYCELVAAAAFTAAGASVALPFGNQAGWDMIVEENGALLRVQVKAAKFNRSSRLSRVSLVRYSGAKGLPKTRRRYARRDFDQLVAVLPETGTIWRLPFESIVGKSAVSMPLDSAWMPGAISDAMKERPTTAPLANPIRIDTGRLPILSGNRGKRSSVVSAVGGELPATRPDFVGPDLWNLLVAHVVEKKSITALAHASNRSSDFVRSKLNLALSQLGINPSTQPRGKTTHDQPSKIQRLKGLLPNDPPAGVPLVNWTNLKRHVDGGVPIGAIARELGVSPCTTREALIRVVKRLGMLDKIADPM